MKTYLIDGQRDFPVLRIRKNSNGTVLVAPTIKSIKTQLLYGEQFLIANSRLWTPKEREAKPRPIFYSDFWRRSTRPFYTATTK